MTPDNKKVAYVLAYRSPNYIRTQNILTALQALPTITLHIARNRRSGVLRYLETLIKLISIRIRYRPDIYILGFRGHEIYWLVRLISWNKPLIFDSLMSPYSALKQEGKAGTLGVAASRLVYFLERAILCNSSHIITDTENHVRYLSATFNVATNKITALPMSAVETAPRDKGKIDLSKIHPAWRNRDHSLKVLFYGSFLPLHGVDVLLDAIAQIDPSMFSFHFIGGGGNRLLRFHQQVKRLAITNISHEKWVKFDDLLNNYIPFADICLGGPFGNTPQSQRVITGKTVQCLAQAKVTIIGKIDSAYALKNHHNCLLVEQGNPAAIRDALIWAAQHRDRLSDIGNQGMELYRQYFSSAQLQEILSPMLEKY